MSNKVISLEQQWWFYCHSLLNSIIVEPIFKLKGWVMTSKFLLVGDMMATQWPMRLARALLPLGDLNVLTEHQLAESNDQYLERYDWIIVDASAVTDVVQLVSSLKERVPHSKIVVVTTSPTWRRARDVLQAGALDYLRKPLDEKKMRAEFECIVKRYSPDNQNLNPQEISS